MRIWLGLYNLHCGPNGICSRVNRSRYEAVHFAEGQHHGPQNDVVFELACGHFNRKSFVLPRFEQGIHIVWPDQPWIQDLQVVWELDILALCYRLDFRWRAQ
jgi:hypothetical protein